MIAEDAVVDYRSPCTGFPSAGAPGSSAGNQAGASSKTQTHSPYVTILFRHELGRRLRRLIGTYAGQALAPACQLRHVADPPDALFR